MKMPAVVRSFCAILGAAASSPAGPGVIVISVFLTAITGILISSWPLFPNNETWITRNFTVEDKNCETYRISYSVEARNNGEVKRPNWVDELQARIETRIGRGIQGYDGKNGLLLFTFNEDLEWKENKDIVIDRLEIKISRQKK